MDYKVSIGGEYYEVIDSLNNITLADSFVKNKIGSGHGEAKLYVGNEGTTYNDFFDDLNRDFFFVKEDFSKYLLDAKDEFLNPQQDYIKKSEMPQIYSDLCNRIETYRNGILSFKLDRVDVEPPRVYMRSPSQYYELMRDLGIPNISYLSIMKVKSKAGKIYYYCRMFVDYKDDIVKYDYPGAAEAEQRIENSNISPRKKETLIQARIGQGEYRRKLIEEF